MLPLDPWTHRRPEADAPPLALGTMNLGKRTDARESERIIARALERGVTLIDTANAYNDGESERVVGRALRGKRDAALLATKVGFGRISGKSEGLSRARVKAALDESLERLGTDHVDLYYLHVPDHTTPIADTLLAIAEALETKKIRAYGISNYASWQVLETMRVADAMGMPKPVISQVVYNLLIRQLDLEYAAFARRYALHTTTYNALAGGLLAGHHDRTAPAPKGSRFDKNRIYQGRYWTERFFDLVDAYKAVAADEGMTLVDLSYAFLTSSPVVDSILVGPATVEQLDAAIDGCARRLSPEGQEKIDTIHRAFLGTETSYAR